MSSEFRDIYMTDQLLSDPFKVKEQMIADLQTLVSHDVTIILPRLYGDLIEDLKKLKQINDLETFKEVFVEIMEHMGDAITLLKDEEKELLIRH
jgi:hypothetical protein